jgi:two-component system, OmpR family, sensor histidine kinase ResE
MRENPQDSNAIRGINTYGNNTVNLFERLYRSLKRQNAPAGGNTPSEDLRQLRRIISRRDADLDRLNSIIHQLDQGIILQDNEGRIIIQNETATRLIGSRKDYRDSELTSLLNAFRDIRKIESELTPLGEPTRLQLNNMIIGAQIAAVADSAGNRIGTLIVLRDVTREALNDRLKDQFIAAISHELRTPMAVIKGASELIANQPDRAPNPKFLDTISRNVDILDRMIVELLDISEMTANAFQVRRDPIDFEELIWQVEGGMRPEVKKAKLDVMVMMKDVQRLHVMGDQQRLRWALGHLFQNSIRYTESGGHITVIAGPSGNTHIAIQVIDNGVGISNRDLPHVFDRFYRGEPRTKSGKLLDPRGLGQGLFVARTVTEAHGGYLTVQSDVGQGSIFTMVLPSESAA